MATPAEDLIIRRETPFIIGSFILSGIIMSMSTLAAISAEPIALFISDQTIDMVDGSQVIRNVNAATLLASKLEIAAVILSIVSGIVTAGMFICGFVGGYFATAAAMIMGDKSKRELKLESSNTKLLEDLSEQRERISSLKNEVNEYKEKCSQAQEAILFLEDLVDEKKNIIDKLQESRQVLALPAKAPEKKHVALSGVERFNIRKRY